MIRRLGITTITLAIALFALFYASCSSNGNDEPEFSSSSHDIGSEPSSSSGENNGSFGEGEQVYNFNLGTAGNAYTGSGKVYIISEGPRGVVLTEEKMLEVGEVNNGKITFNLPNNVDSRFLDKLAPMPAGATIDPIDAEALFYIEPLRLVNNNEYIGDLEYEKITSAGIGYKISYTYFPIDTYIDGSFTEDEIEIDYEFKINAKEGWNKVYWYIDAAINTNDNIKVYFTTNLNEAPDDLNWLFK